MSCKNTEGKWENTRTRGGGRPTPSANDDSPSGKIVRRSYHRLWESRYNCPRTGFATGACHPFAGHKSIFIASLYAPSSALQPLPRIFTILTLDFYIRLCSVHGIFFTKLYNFEQQQKFDTSRINVLMGLNNCTLHCNSCTSLRNPANTDNAWNIKDR